MGVRFPSTFSAAFTNAAASLATETIIMTLPPLNISVDFAVIFLLMYMNVTIGTAGTAAVMRCRRGTLVTGVQIGAPVAVATAAAAVLNFSLAYADTPGAVAGQQYVMTLQVTAATANSPVNDATFAAFSL